RHRRDREDRGSPARTTAEAACRAKDHDRRHARGEARAGGGRLRSGLRRASAQALDSTADSESAGARRARWSGWRRRRDHRAARWEGSTRVLERARARDSRRVAGHMTIARPDDERWMSVALDEARSAGQAGEVPVGAVIVRGGELFARAGN